VSCSNSPIYRGGEIVGAALVVRDVTERHEAEQRRQLLINELNHRVKNTLAIVQGVAQQTFKGETCQNEQRETFEARLVALAAAHNLLTQRNWEDANLGEIVVRSLAPFTRLREDRLLIEGPDLLLGPNAAVSLSMAFHELGTNALKYGALSNETGRVFVEWRFSGFADERRLTLTWREEGGPPVRVPKKRGFGSRLIERALAAELRGRVALDFRPEGVTWSVDAPLSSATRVLGEQLAVGSLERQPPVRSKGGS
jgi:two-component sensor histidine kinase